MIAIIDYGCGNILSLKRALDEIGLKNKVTSSQEEIHNSNCIILPGVGAFENAITLLKKKDLLNLIVEIVKQKKKPLIGICLGMQMLSPLIEGVSRALTKDKLPEPAQVDSK